MRVSNGLIIGGAVVLAVGIGAYAYLKRGGGQQFGSGQNGGPLGNAAANFFGPPAAGAPAQNNQQGQPNLLGDAAKFAATPEGQNVVKGIEQGFSDFGNWLVSVGTGA